MTTTPTNLDMLEAFFAFDDLGDDATERDWQGLVKLVETLPEPDKSNHTNTVAELGGRLGFIDDGDIEAAFRRALAAD